MALTVDLLCSPEGLQTKLLGKDYSMGHINSLPLCHIRGHRISRPTVDDVKSDQLAEVTPASCLHTQMPCSLCKLTSTLGMAANDSVP